MKNSFPTVSFIIPTLNASKFIGRCLKAIRNQSYPGKIEIIIADGGSTDNTRVIAKKYNAKIIDNPEVIHEPGKARASQVAKGEILFYTDADNIIVGKNWVQLMVKPYIDNPDIMGFLPQTEAPKDSSSLNQYLGHLFTDPFTWFVYGNAANPKTYPKVFHPVKSTPNYTIYKFTPKNHPLFGLSQGVGTTRSFKRVDSAYSDDILAGIKLIQNGGLIAYVPEASVHHYHVNGVGDFIRKYRWRIRNNLQKKVKGMGFVNREKYLSKERLRRKKLFVLYSFSVVLPLVDSIKLTLFHKSLTMFWHAPLCFLLSIQIVLEVIKFRLRLNSKIGVYGS